MKAKIVQTSSFKWNSQGAIGDLEIQKINEANKETSKEGEYLNRKVVFFCLEKGDDIEDFLKVLDKTEVNNSIYFPYAHLSSELMGLSEAIGLFKKIKEKVVSLNGVITPFYEHKPYDLKTSIKPDILFIDTRAEEVEESKEDLKNSHTGNIYVDNLVATKESLKGSYFKLPIAVAIEREVQRRYRFRLLQKFNFIRELESPLIFNYKGKLVERYLKKFPARQFTLKAYGETYFNRIATCHAMFTLMSKDKNLKPPIGYYEKALCFRKEQAGEIKKGERHSAFTMPDCHIVVKVEQVVYYFEKLLSFMKEYYKEIGLSYKVILRTSTDLFKDLEVDERVSINKDNYFCEKLEFEVSGIQLATIQVDLQNPIVYFKNADLAIIHFSCGSLERICQELSKDLSILKNLFPTYLIKIVEDNQIKKQLDLSILIKDTYQIKSKEQVLKIINEIGDTFYNLIVIGEKQKKNLEIRSSFRCRYIKGPLKVSNIELS